MCVSHLYNMQTLEVSVCTLLKRSVSCMGEYYQGRLVISSLVLQYLLLRDMIENNATALSVILWHRCTESLIFCLGTARTLASVYRHSTISVQYIHCYFFFVFKPNLKTFSIGDR